MVGSKKKRGIGQCAMKLSYSKCGKLPKCYMIWKQKKVRLNRMGTDGVRNLVRISSRSF